MNWLLINNIVLINNSNLVRYFLAVGRGHTVNTLIRLTEIEFIKFLVIVSIQNEKFHTTDWEAYNFIIYLCQRNLPSSYI